MIARNCQVLTYDLRHHGESGKPPVGFHIARLAADLHNLLNSLNLDNVTVVGSSMGAAIIWSYFELFAGERIAQAVFVDQAPLQNIAIDWKAGSTGCYDIASLTRLQVRLLTDFKGFAKDNALFCSGPGIAPDAMKVLESETLRANPVALAALMVSYIF
jgi:pimeloyl-ACP methyl ester carboxylesterase